MHVAFNAYFWNQPQVGSGQYLRQLVTHLNRLVSDLDITLVFPQGKAGEVAGQVPPGVQVVTVPLFPGHAGKVWFEQAGFSRACRQVGADLAHVPYWGSPLRSPVPVVVTIHDIITMLIPEYHRSPLARLYNGLVGASARGAARVITDSQASKRDIASHLGIDAAGISAIPLAVSPRYSPQPDLLLDMAIARQYQLPERYLLYLGGYALHKNVVTLLQAYAYVVKALGDDFPLVLAGARPDRPSPRFPDYDRHLAQLKLQEHVRWIGFVEEEHKPAVYRQASAFVFPSRYEGFGLPPLEAMACGVPVIATAVSSMPEVVGDAAFAVEPFDERGMAGAMIATLLQEEVARQLRDAGRRQAALFSWERTARETLLVYASAVETGR